MANLNTQSFSSIVSNFATAVQSAASSLVDFTIGSVLRAIAEAMAGVALWLQGLILQVAALTRAATSSGTDLDSFFAQFGFSRLGGTAATTQETFARYTPTNQALIPLGATVQTQDGSIQFTVVADTSNAAYSASQGGYVLPANQASVNVTVQCTAVGTTANVTAGQLNTLGTAIAGVDFVTNSNAVTNGANAESDAAARSRFVTWIASLEAATLLAVMNAIDSVQIGMTGIIAENQQYNGAAQNGYFTVIANDGSGTLTLTEKTNVENAVEAVRPLCSTYSVHAPTTQSVNVTATITTADGYVHANLTGPVATAMAAYINAQVTTLGGATLSYAGVAAQAFSVAGVTNISNLLLNGGTTDIVIDYKHAFAAGTITVS